MKKKITIVGGGACAIFLANQLDSSLFEISIYERTASVGRKFLVAGHGGLNLTHSEPADLFVTRYSPEDFLRPSFLRYDNVAFRQWLQQFGIFTKVGSSGRVFPDGKLKPAQVLEILRKGAEDKGVHFYYKHEWKGFDTNTNLIFETNAQTITVASAYTVFCMGGASWSVTGSKGDWQSYFSDKSISTVPFEASNCNFLVDWPKSLAAQLAGKPLKNCVISCETVSRAGELVITEKGIEGSGVYPFSPLVRKQLKAEGTAVLMIDLKPTKSVDEIEQVLLTNSSKPISTLLKTKLALSSQAIHLLKAKCTKSEFSEPKFLANLIKKLPLHIIALAPIDEAISTVGGISLTEIDDMYQFKKLPGHYAIGEMLDFDAPTGGYLLQACFSMAMQLAAHLNSSLKLGKNA